MSHNPNDMNPKRRPRMRRVIRTDNVPYVEQTPAPYIPPNHPNQFVIGMPGCIAMFFRQWRLVIAVMLLTSACWLCLLGTILTTPPAGS